MDHPPRVLISYSHDSATHRDRVRALADRLRGEGIDVRLDQYTPHPPEGWPRWMQRQIDEADYIVVVCTETYRRRFEGREPPAVGRGVTWEGLVLTQALYDAGALNHRILPVSFAGAAEEVVPTPLRPYTRYTLDNEYEALYRRLTGQPATPPPPLGPRRVLPPVHPTLAAEPRPATEPRSAAESRSVEAPRSAMDPGAPGPTPPAESVRILHLSDLHLRPKTDWDAEPLLARLPDAVRALRDAGLAPDLVAITGDVAFSAKPAEYALARAWLLDRLLPACGLGPEALVAVPGNHDVDRGAGESEVVRAVEQAVYTGDEGRAAAILNDPAQWAVLAPRYTAWLQFLHDVGVTHGGPSWSATRTIRGLRVHLAGLDSAWLASGDAPKGRLVLGLAQVNARLRDASRADVTIALLHHPTGWLVDWDERAVLPPLRAQADVLLRGHLHEPDLSVVRGAHHQLVELPAGSLYAGSAWPNAFQLVEVGTGGGRTQVWTWHAPAWAWVPDRTGFPPDGWFDFSWRARR